MPGRLIGTARAVPLAEKAQSILKINGNYSFFALPTDMLEKYGIDSFDIIQKQDKTTLVAPSGTEQANESHKPSTSKEVVATSG